VTGASTTNGNVYALSKAVAKDLVAKAKPKAYNIDHWVWAYYTIQHVLCLRLG